MGRTARKTTALLYLLLMTVFQRLVCGINRLRRVATKSIDSLPYFVVCELQLSSPTQILPFYTLLPTHHAHEKKYQARRAHSYAKVNHACGPGNDTPPRSHRCPDRLPNVDLATTAGDLVQPWIASPWAVCPGQHRAEGVGCGNFRNETNQSSTSQQSISKFTYIAWA